jgi:Protein of unknown function, DUF547
LDKSVGTYRPRITKAGTPVIPYSGICLLNGLLNRALRVDSRLALNDNLELSEMPTQHVAEELRRVVNEIKANAYDPERQSVDYARVRNGPAFANLRQCTAQLRFFDPANLQTDPERFAFWINVYNVLIVDAVIAFGIRRTVWEDKGFFRRAAYRIGGLRCSADAIEHGILRANRRPPYIPFPVFAENDPRRQWAVHRLDPRIHTALNCASRSCPPIAVYAAEVIDEQLALAARSFVNSTTEVVQGGEGRLTLQLSPIFKWYSADFGGSKCILDFVLKYLATQEARAQIARGDARLKIEWTRYDWSLNRAA